MDEQELNKKLAEWAGFKLKKVQCVGMVYYETMQDCWYYNGSEYGFNVPDFTQSVDACFKWLIPGLISEACQKLFLSEPYAYKMLYNRWGDELITGMEHPSTLMTVVHPALALCLTIDKLIGWTSKVENSDSDKHTTHTNHE